MNKKEIVINIARDLFTSYGYKKVSMDEIALKSGITKKTIYTYFKDKDSLFNYFIMEEINKMKLLIEEEEKKETNAFKLLNKVLYKMLLYKKESKFLSMIAQEAFTLKKSYVIKHIETIDKEIQNYIKLKLEKRILNGEIKKCDTEVCSFIIYKIYISVMFELDSKNLNEKEITENVTKILKEGLFN